MLALAACDDFDALLCARLECDGGVDAGLPDAGTPDGGIDGGADSGVDAGVDAGLDAGFDAGADALAFTTLAFIPTLVDRVRVKALVAGSDFTVLAADGIDAQLTNFGVPTGSIPYRPEALALWNNTVLLGGDGGVELWDSTTTMAAGHLAPSSPLIVTNLTTFDDGASLGALAVGVDPSGALAWAELHAADGGGPMRAVACLPSSLATTSKTNGGEHFVIGVGAGAGCAGGLGGDVFFGRWLRGDTSLALPLTGAIAVAGTGVHAASDNVTPMFSWQDDAGIRLARVRSGASLEVAPAPVVPLTSTAPVASDLTLYSSGNEFVLVLDSLQGSQGLQLSDGGVQPLELGVPVIVTGAWGTTGAPTILRVRVLRTGHWVAGPRLAHSLTDDVYLAATCQTGGPGPFRDPCPDAGPGHFLIRVQRE